MFYGSLNTRPAFMDPKSPILWSNFMNSSSLLSPIKLSKYASIISICHNKNPKIADMAKKILSDLNWKVKEKVLLKSMLSIWENFQATSLVWYLTTYLSGWYFTLNTHLKSIAALLFGRSSYFHLFCYSSCWNSTSMASLNCQP